MGFADPNTRIIIMMSVLAIGWTPGLRLELPRLDRGEGLDPTDDLRRLRSHVMGEDFDKRKKDAVSSSRVSSTGTEDQGAENTAPC